MTKKESSIHLISFLVKKEYQNEEFKNFIKSDMNVKNYSLLSKLDVDGHLFIKKTTENRPTWEIFLNSIAEDEIDELINRSNSAVLIVH